MSSGAITVLLACLRERGKGGRIKLVARYCLTDFAKASVSQASSWLWLNAASVTAAITSRLKSVSSTSAQTLPTEWWRAAFSRYKSDYKLMRRIYIVLQLTCFSAKTSYSSRSSAASSLSSIFLRIPRQVSRSLRPRPFLRMRNIQEVGVGPRLGLTCYLMGGLQTKLIITKLKRIWFHTKRPFSIVYGEDFEAAVTEPRDLCVKRISDT